MFNEVLRLNYEGWDWDRIEDVVEQNADLVQNTAQRVIDKAFDALDNYYDNDDWGRPQYKHETFPLRMNYGEGYNLFLENNGSIRFRISAKPYKDLKDMRDDIEYGTRMNRRLHSLPFAKLRDFITYKAAWHGIPSDDVDPEYTSQRCPLCGHTERANRQGKRFKCQSCEHQDHSDRGAGISVAQKWLKTQDNRDVPALNTLPQVQKWELRRQASGPVDGPTVASDTVRGDQTDGVRLIHGKKPRGLDPEAVHRRESEGIV